MSLLLANVLSTLMALASLAALVVVGRKANETIKLGKVLALRVAAASNGLERAVKAIQSERTDLSDENNKLEARLAETQRVRREMEEAIEELNRLRKALTRDMRHARNVADNTPRRQEKSPPPPKPCRKKRTPCRSSCAARSGRQPSIWQVRHERRNRGQEHAAGTGRSH